MTDTQLTLLLAILLPVAGALLLALSAISRRFARAPRHRPPP